MLSKRFITIVSMLVITICVLMITPVAASSADGCDALADRSNPAYLYDGPEYTQFQGTFWFDAGTTIYWDLSAGPNDAVSPGASWTFLQVSISGTPINSYLDNGAASGIELSGSYVIPTDGDYTVHFLAYDANGYIKGSGAVYSFDAGCGSKGGATSNSGTGDVVEVIPVFNPLDDRVNSQTMGSAAVAYSVRTAESQSLNVYCWDEINEVAWIAFAITDEDVNGLEPTGESQLIREVSEGNCYAQFWMLGDGQYQLNIYGDNGKIYEFRDWDLDFNDAEASYFDPNE